MTCKQTVEILTILLNTLIQHLDRGLTNVFFSVTFFSVQTALHNWESYNSY